MDARLVSPRAEAQEDDPLLRRLALYAAIGLFILAFLAALQVAADIVVPVFSAVVAGAILARIIDRLVGLGFPPALAGFGVVVVAIALAVLMINALIDPFSAFVARAPDMIDALMRMAAPILGPLGHLKRALFSSAGANEAAPALGNGAEWIAAFLGRLTPALGELLVFFATLAFFVAGRASLRKQVVLAMPAREARLKALRGFDAVEDALALYFGATTLVYLGVGVATTAIAFACGLSNPWLWGAMTFVAAYIPYLGVALITASLAASGLLTHPHSFFALVPAAAYLAVHSATELFVIPTLLGRRHNVNPFLIFISIVFWSWMWGPVGAILATPLLLTIQSLIGVVAEDDSHLP